MDSSAKNDRLPSPGSLSSGNADGAEPDADAEDLQFFRQMAKVARHTTAREIDRLFEPAAE